MRGLPFLLFWPLAVVDFQRAIEARLLTEPSALLSMRRRRPGIARPRPEHPAIALGLDRSERQRIEPAGTPHPARVRRKTEDPGDVGGGEGFVIAEGDHGNECLERQLLGKVRGIAIQGDDGEGVFDPIARGRVGLKRRPSSGRLPRERFPSIGLRRMPAAIELASQASLQSGPRADRRERCGEGRAGIIGTRGAGIADTLFADARIRRPVCSIGGSAALAARLSFSIFATR